MKKQGGGEGVPNRKQSARSASPRIFLSSLPRYLLTSLPLGALRAPLATLFHPWLANDSANTSSPISTGAKRLRAPSAFPRTPLRPLQTTSVLCESRFIGINIAGSKLVRG